MQVFSITKKKVLSLLALIVIILAAVSFYFSHRISDHSGVLWKFVSQQCVPNMEQHQRPNPCEKVDLSAGYVLFKDRVGPLQYLLMPVQRITGIESSLLQQPTTPNFFLLAWQQRHLLSEKHLAAIPDSQLAMTINSVSGRTQNQLHIHLSCLRSDIARQLNQSSESFSDHWQTISLRSHPYLIRTLSPAQLAAESVFIRVAQEIPGAADNMGDYGLALTTLQSGELALLAVKKDLLKANTGSAEELQDHSCQILAKHSGT